MIWDTSLVNLGVIVCPPRILPILSALMGRMLCQHCSAVATTLLCYAQLSSYQFKAQYYGGCQGEN